MVMGACVLCVGSDLNLTRAPLYNQACLPLNILVCFVNSACAKAVGLTAEEGHAPHMSIIDTHDANILIGRYARKQWALVLKAFATVSDKAFARFESERESDNDAQSDAGHATQLTGQGDSENLPDR